MPSIRTRTTIDPHCAVEYVSVIESYHSSTTEIETICSMVESISESAIEASEVEGACTHIDDLLP